MQKKIYNYFCYSIASVILSASFTKVHASSLSEADEIAMVKSTAPYAVQKSTDIIWPKDAAPLTIDGAKLGKTIKTTGTSSSAIWLDTATNYLYANMSNPDWKTFRSSALPDEWTATSTLTLTSILHDGATPGGGTTWSIEITLTKGASSSIATLTRTALSTLLQNTTVRNLSILTGTGTTLSGAGMTAGWVATARIKNDSGTVVAGVLDESKVGFTLPMTPVGSTRADNYQALTTTHQFNVAAGATDQIPVVFTSAGSQVTFNVMPGNITTRTDSIANAIVAAFNTYTDRRFLAEVKVKTFYNDIKTAAAALKALYVTSDDAPLIAKLAGPAKSKIEASTYVIGDFTTTADTNNYGLVVIGNADLTSVTWSTGKDASTGNALVIAKGKIGTQVLKEFVCDITTQASSNIIKDDTNSVLRFTSPDGDSFYVKSFDSTGLDTSAVTTYGTANQDDLLAMNLADKLSAVTTITHKAGDAF